MVSVKGKNEREIMDILKKERREIQDEAYIELQAQFTQGGTETGWLQHYPNQATDNLAQIRRTWLMAQSALMSKSVFAGTNVLDLYRQANGLEATDKVYYGQVSELVSQLSGEATKEPWPRRQAAVSKGARTLTSMPSIRTGNKGSRRTGSGRNGLESQLDNIQRGGFGGLGMIDPRGYSDGALALLDRGLADSPRHVPEEASEESAAEPVRSEEGEAPKTQVLALEALTGPGVDPYPVQQTSNDQGDEKLARVINQSNWALFSRIWGSGTSSQSDGAKYTVQHRQCLR